jgi:hypothetical protein
MVSGGLGENANLRGDGESGQTFSLGRTGMPIGQAAVNLSSQSASVSFFLSQESITWAG